MYSGGEVVDAWDTLYRELGKEFLLTVDTYVIIAAPAFVSFAIVVKLFSRGLVRWTSFYSFLSYF